MRHGLSVFLLLCGLWLLLAMPALAADLAIVGAKVYPSPQARPIANGTVLVRDGRIAAVGPARRVRVPDGVRVVDGAGATLVAGFWNSHVHLTTPELLRTAEATPQALNAALGAMFLRWGFTSVFEIAGVPGNALALRRRIEAGEVRGPMLLTVDAPFYPEHGTPVYVRPLMEKMGLPSAEVASAEAGRRRARAQLDAGADGVKLFTGAILGGEADVLAMDAEIGAAVVAEARARGKPAFAHPTNERGLEAAIASGVDVLAHTAPVAGPWSQALVRRLRAREIALIPTLMLFDLELEKEQVPQAVYERFMTAARQQVRAYAAAGGQILFGTDVGFIEEADTTREYRQLAAAGLDWRAVLASLTTAPAQRFGHAARKGRIAPGMDADLVLLRRDPAADPLAFAQVLATVRGGEVLYEAPAAAPAPAP